MEKKPNFEALSKEYFPDPRDRGSAISLLERVVTPLQSQLSAIEEKHKQEFTEYTQAYQLKQSETTNALYKELSFLQSQNERLLSALKDTTERMKRARSILTDREGQPDCWQMLNAEKHEQLINEIEKQ